MTEVSRTVATSYPNDAGRGIARIDPDTMLELKMSPGDIIAVDGPQRTAAKAWRADREDWEAGTVRLDGFTRYNAGVEIDDTVTINRADPAPAETVELAPPAEDSPDFGTEAAAEIRDQCRRRPVTVDDVLPVMAASDAAYARATYRAHPYSVLETRPDGIVEFVGTTDIRIDEDVGRAGSGAPRAERELPDTESHADEVRIDSDRVELLAHHLSTREPSGGPGSDRSPAVVGTVENVGVGVIALVSIGVTFYADEDATVHLGHRTRSTTQLKPGKRWPFEVRVPAGSRQAPRAYDIEVTVE